MFALIFEKGIVTLSWYAWLALRRRVSMSAIGSVIVMGVRQPFSPGFPVATRPTAKRYFFNPPSVRSWAVAGGDRTGLPGSLGHTGQLTAVGHLPDTDPAEAELAVDRVRPATTLAAGVRPHSELRLRGSLQDQRLLGHTQFSLNGKPRSLSSARPSSSVLAVVTTVMSMPRVRSIRSWSISWNTDCSVRPNV